MVQLSRSYMTSGKTIALTIWTFVGKVMSPLFSTLSRFVIAFLPRSKHLWISWLQSPSAVILEPKKIKSVTVSIVSLSVYHELCDCMPWSSFPNVEFYTNFFTFIKRLFSSSSVSAMRVSSAYLRLLIFLLEVLIPSWTSNNRLVPNWEIRMLRLYTVTLLI